MLKFLAKKKGKRKGLCQFLNIPIIQHRAENQKQLMTHSSEKRRTDGGTDRQTDNGDFIGSSVGRGSRRRKEWKTYEKRIYLNH